jgi:hypothetical protein
VTMRPSPSRALAEDPAVRAQEGREAAHCPGREPLFLAVKRLAHPSKTAIQNRFTMENAEAA